MQVSRIWVECDGESGESQWNGNTRYVSVSEFVEKRHVKTYKDAAADSCEIFLSFWCGFEAYEEDELTF